MLVGGAADGVRRDERAAAGGISSTEERAAVGVEAAGRAIVMADGERAAPAGQRPEQQSASPLRAPPLAVQAATGRGRGVVSSTSRRQPKTNPARASSAAVRAIAVGLKVRRRCPPVAARSPPASRSEGRQMASGQPSRARRIAAGRGALHRASASSRRAPRAPRPAPAHCRPGPAAASLAAPRSAPPRRARFGAWPRGPRARVQRDGRRSPPRRAWPLPVRLGAQVAELVLAGGEIGRRSGRIARVVAAGRRRRAGRGSPRAHAPPRVARDLWQARTTVLARRLSAGRDWGARGWGAPGVGSGADAGPVTGHLALSPAATRRSLPSAIARRLHRLTTPTIRGRSITSMVPTHVDATDRASLPPRSRRPGVAQPWTSTVPLQRRSPPPPAVPASDSPAGPARSAPSIGGRDASASARRSRAISRSAGTSRAPTADDAPPIVGVPVTRASCRRTQAAPRSASPPADRRAQAEDMTIAASAAPAPGTPTRPPPTDGRRRLLGLSIDLHLHSPHAHRSGASGACARILGAARGTRLATGNQRTPRCGCAGSAAATGSSRPSTTSTRRPSTSLQVTASFRAEPVGQLGLVAYIAARCDDERRAPALSPR